MAPNPQLPRAQTQGRKLLRYAARGALIAIVAYSLLVCDSASSSACPALQKYKPNLSLNQLWTENSYESSPNAAVTFWSTASEPQATPNHVEEPAPEPEEITETDVQSDPIDKSATDTVLEAIQEAEENVEEFLAGLFDEDEISVTEEQVVPPPPPPVRTPLTPEEIEANKEQLRLETIEKRADITVRHAEWEKKLKEKGQAEEKALLAKIKQLRDDVVMGMRVGPEIFDRLRKMNDDGEKSIKGSEAWLKKNMESAEDLDHKKTMWEKIHKKVNDKLGARLVEMGGWIKSLYDEHMGKEAATVEEAVKALDKLSDDAQADLGMDYAWLDDVTTQDWVRYHDLKRTSANYGDIFQTIFNSTHEELPKNVVADELAMVQRAMVNVARDLDELLEKVNKKADRFFKGEPEEIEPPLEPVLEAFEKPDQVPAIPVEKEAGHEEGSRPIHVEL